MDLFHLRSVLLWVDRNELPQVAQTRQSNLQLISTTRKESAIVFLFQQTNFSSRMILESELRWENCATRPDVGVSLSKTNRAAEIESMAVR